MTVVDLFEGAGGWSHGLAGLGINTVGVELDRWATLTARAAGHQVPSTRSSHDCPWR